MQGRHNDNYRFAANCYHCCTVLDRNAGLRSARLGRPLKRRLRYLKSAQLLGKVGGNGENEGKWVEMEDVCGGGGGGQWENGAKLGKPKNNMPLLATFGQNTRYHPGPHP